MNRKKIGISLVFLGLIPWLALTAYIVYTQTPPGFIVLTTIICWATMFTGKTLLKDKGHIRNSS